MSPSPHLVCALALWTLSCTKGTIKPSTPPKTHRIVDLGPSEDASPTQDLAPIPVMPQGGPAPMFGMDPQHTGRSPYPAPKAQPKELWHYTTGGSITSAPVIAQDGTLLFGSHDRYLYALSREGELRWRFATRDRVFASPALDAEGLVYAGSDDDQVYFLTLAEGNQRAVSTVGPCKRQVVAPGERSGPESARCDINALTLGGDGTLYTGGDGIYAFAKDGSLRFRFVPAHKVHCASAPALSPEGVIYAGCQDDTVYALSQQGNKLWEFHGQDDFDGSPAVSADGTIYIGSDDRKLYALTKEGQVRFTFSTRAPIRSTPAIAQDGTIYVGSLDGHLYGIRPDGTQVSDFRAADRILSSPIIDRDGMVLFGAQDDRLYALQKGGTHLAWSVLLEGDVDGSPALGPDGTVYIGDEFGTFYAFR